LTPAVDERPDGTIVLRAVQALGDYPVVLTDRLAYWAGVAPDRTLLAWNRGDDVARATDASGQATDTTKRATDNTDNTATASRGQHGHHGSGSQGRSFEHVTYGDALRKVRCLGQALLDRHLSADRPLAILSGNSVEHLLLALAAQHVGVPYAPVSPAYSLISTDFGALKHVLALLTPGLVFVSDAPQFARALDAAVDSEVEVAHAVSFAPRSPRRRTVTFEELLSTTPTPEVDRRHAAIAPDDVAKILFTSGSTGTPKGVINTHRMICSNQQMILQTLPFLGDEPPVLVDWLPWHHTFGGNHNVGIVVYNGGSLYLDEGRPVAGGFDESVRNLRAIAPTVYLNVPKGFEELVRAFAGDPALAARFFGRVRVLFYAAAGLSQHVADELQRIAIEACGERLVLVTGLGSTETAPMAICRPWASELSAAIGLPVPGVDVKLVPVGLGSGRDASGRPLASDPAGGKLEIRVRGPNVTPGYWRQEALTRDALDDEGFYCMGDAARFVDPRDRSQGLVFDGRIKEDFKLSTGTWVSVGPLRARILAHFAPYVRDAVIAGHDRDEVGMLVVPDIDACRRLCPDLPASAAAAAVIGHAGVRHCLRTRLATFAAGSTGSATRIGRAIVLTEPPSLDAGEVTDKGSLNQRAILERRASLVDDLYAEPPPPHVITKDEPAP
jgi:feruloyl-CoA synthase